MRKLETIFGELLKLVPRYQFEKAIKQYQGDRYVKSYTAWHQYITILFIQIKRKESPKSSAEWRDDRRGSSRQAIATKEVPCASIFIFFNAVYEAYNQRPVPIRQ